jgi:hypothetical protein
MNRCVHLWWGSVWTHSSSEEGPELHGLSCATGQAGQPCEVCGASQLTPLGRQDPRFHLQPLWNSAGPQILPVLSLSPCVSHSSLLTQK